jgi:putative ABC transport system ATP-binding protein
MIHLDDVHLTLPSSAGPVNILRGISLEIAAGEAVGLVGPSGSGKSTLLMAVAGLEAITSGLVEVAEKRLDRLGEDDLARFRRDNVGIVFQSFHLIPTMTAIENVAIPLELNGEPDAHARARAELERVGLSHRFTHYPGQLSGGEQQRVALARALAAGARILLADEPTGNLDLKTGEQVIDLIFEVQRERSMTLLLITHDPELAGRCGRVVTMGDGLIVDDERAGALSLAADAQ